MSKALKKSIAITSANPGVLTPAQLIRYVRRHSPFYRSLYAHLPDTAQLKDLPILNPNDFWAANAQQEHSLFTQPMNEGIAFRSGGTTGIPKFSVFTKKEWQTIIEVNAEAFAKGGFEQHDRVANLFFSGSMYGSLLFSADSINSCSLDLLQFPIGGQTPIDEILKHIAQFKINVLLAAPTTLNLLIEAYEKNPQLFPNTQINKIFYAGEMIFEDQRQWLKKVLPNLQIYSLGYASNDGGVLGYTDKTCGVNEFRTFGQHTVLELIDEATSEVIEDTEREGVLVLTSLFRTLMPTLRYPVGDRGKWIEPKGSVDRKFKLLSRTESAIKIMNILFYPEDIHGLLKPYKESHRIFDFQIILDAQNKKSRVTFKIASKGNPTQLQELATTFLKAFEKMNPNYRKLLESAEILPFEVVWIRPEDLEINPRTGKLKRVIDTRV